MINDILSRIHKPAALVLVLATLLIIAFVVLLVAYRQLPAAQAFVGGALLLALHLAQAWQPRMLPPKPPETT